MCILTTSFATENTCIFFWFQEASLLANVGVIKIIKAFDVPHIIQCAAIARECKKVVMNFKALSSSVPSHYDSSHCLRFHFLWVRRFLHYLGGKLAPSFCRINDVVPFTCQFWNRKVFFFPWNFPSLGTVFAERTWTSPALFLVAYGSKHIYHWMLSDTTIWPLTAGKGQKAQPWKIKMCLCARGSSSKLQVSQCVLLTLNFCPWNVLISIPTKGFRHDSYFKGRSNIFLRSTERMCLHYVWCMCEKERERQRKEEGELPGWAFIILKCTKMSLGEKEAVWLLKN